MEIKLRRRAPRLKRPMTVARARARAPPRARTSTTSARRSPPPVSKFGARSTESGRAVLVAVDHEYASAVAARDGARLVLPSENVASRWRVHSREWSETCAA